MRRRNIDHTAPHTTIDDTSLVEDTDNAQQKTSSNEDDNEDVDLVGDEEKEKIFHEHDLGDNGNIEIEI